MAAGNKKALAAPKVNANSASALERPSGVGGEAHTSRDSPQPSVSKRKVDEVSSLDCPSETARRRPAPGHLFEDLPETEGTTGEIAAQSSRKLGPTDGCLTYATVVAGIRSPQQKSGTLKSKAKGTVPTEPAASSEAATRRMSLTDMSGLLCGMPDCTTTYAQVAANRATPAVERQRRPHLRHRSHGNAQLLDMVAGLVPYWAFSPN